MTSSSCLPRRLHDRNWANEIHRRVRAEAAVIVIGRINGVRPTIKTRKPCLLARLTTCEIGVRACLEQPIETL